jgi:hypothetical protein
MTYRGHIKDGVVVFDSPIPLPEGAEVMISVVETSMDIDGQPIDPAFLIGDLAVDMGISDLASNIDHYLYGHPKVNDDGK